MSEMLSKLGDYALDRLHGSPLSRIVNHLMGGQPGASGLQALLEKLRGAGLGDKVDSWVGTGPNREIDPAELERAIGPQEAERLAADSGMAKGGLMAVLSQFLPRMVDGLTPNGRVPARDDELPDGGQGGTGGMLGGLLSRLGGQSAAPTGGPGTQGGSTQLDDLLGGLLNRFGVGGAGPETSDPRHASGPAENDFGASRFSEPPAKSDSTTGGNAGSDGTTRRI